MKTVHLSTSPTRPRRNDTESKLKARRFKHRLASDGIESVCLLCGQLLGAAQDEWLLLSLELVHVCAAASHL